MTQFSDSLAVGAAYYTNAANNPGVSKAPGTRDTQVRGVVLSNLVAEQWGAVAAPTVTGISALAFATVAGGTILATGPLVTAGIATMDIARAVNITSTGNESSTTFTITGTDQYGSVTISTITGPNNTTGSSLVAYKTVTSITQSATTVSTIGLNIGTSNVIGTFYKIADKGKVIGIYADGATVTDATIVVGLLATGLTVSGGTATGIVATATTADVRGTLSFPTTTGPNGAKLYTIVTITEPFAREPLYGNIPFGGN